MNWQQQGFIVIRHDAFPNVELYTVVFYFQIVEEGPVSELFNDEIYDLIREKFMEETVVKAEEETEGSKVTRIKDLCVGGEVDLSELQTSWGWLLGMIMTLFQRILYQFKKEIRMDNIYVW